MHEQVPILPNEERLALPDPTTNKLIRSYTSSGSQTSNVLTEFLYLFKGVRRATGNMPTEVAELLRQLREVERLVKEFFGVEISNLDVLEVGVGQLPRQIAYFSQANNVIGIDLDVIISGLQPTQYYGMVRRNGFKRFLKTMARKSLGMDLTFNRELKRALGTKSLPKFRLQTMDATKMTFEDGSFDLVYSFNVFEHLPTPAAVLREIKRVLRPGGCVVSQLHLYTCDSGCHDVRILSGDRRGVPLWAHLRPQFAHLVKNAAYINKLRMSEWAAVFDAEMPGSHLVRWHDPDEAVKKSRLADLRREGQLAEYGDEELITHDLLAFWQKPQ